MSNNIIYVDYREQERVNLAHNFFSKVDINKKPVMVETTKLNSADYKYKDIGVEFKTTTDFINSIKNKRLNREILKMDEDYAKHYVVVAGGIQKVLSEEYFRIKNMNKYSKFKKPEEYLNMNSYIGAIASYNQITNLIQVENTKQAFQLIVSLFEKSTDNKIRTISEPEFKSNNTLITFLSCVEGIKGKAKTIVETLNLKSLQDLLNVEKSELLSVDGIGEKKANDILKWIK